MDKDRVFAEIERLREEIRSLPGDQKYRDGADYALENLAGRFRAAVSMKERLLDALKDVYHSGDYGYLWWNESEGKVWLTMGDADGDEDNGHTPYEEIKRRVLAVLGVKSVEIEDEQDPVDWD